MCYVYVSYLSKGTDDGALYNTSEEDKINIFGSCARWQVFQVVQYLLHCWGVGEEIGQSLKRTFNILKGHLENAGTNSDKIVSVILKEKLNRRK